MSERIERRIRNALWGCEMPWMRGDNLAVTLCSVIQDAIEHGPDDGDCGWPVEVSEAYEATGEELVSRIMAAIEPLRTHAETAEAERDAMRAVVEAAKKVSDEPRAGVLWNDLRRKLAALSTLQGKK